MSPPALMRRGLVVLAAAAAAAGIWSLLPAGPAPVASTPGRQEPVRGAIHVHTRRSDGSGTVDQIAAAAARAGLRFVVFTDHGDGRRRPDPPAYLYGVLCIDAVEISTTRGHVVALGLPGRAPYRLGGDPRDVVEDVARLGGMSIAAHPASGKPALRWTDWDVPFDGLEWLNADSEWRDEPYRTLAVALLTYPFRKPETVAALLDRPSDVFRRWDAMTRRRPVVAMAAADAHASVGLGRFANPYGDRSPLAIPGYEQVFRAFSIALPDAVLTGDAAADAGTVIEEIRGGRLYSIIDALAAPGRLDFSAGSGSARADPGGALPASHPVSFDVHVAGPEGAVVQLVRGGTVVSQGSGDALQFEAAAAGAYRVEVHLPRAPGRPPVPWIVSNPIYVGAFESAPPARGPAPRERAVQFAGEPGGEWAIEQSPQSEGRAESVATLDGHELLLRYALGGGERDGAHVALVLPDAPPIGGYEWMLFRGRSSAPMRVWVQIRGHGPRGVTSWRRSVYLDEQSREVSVRFADMEPVDGQPPIGGAPPPAHDIMFLVDSMHTVLGTSGRIWIDDITYAR